LDIVTVPAFAPQADELFIHASVVTWLTRYGERFAQPYRIEQNHNEDHTRIESIQYFCRMPEFSGNFNRMNVTFRSRGQIRSGGIVLPAPYKPGLYEDILDKTPMEIDDDQLSWVHTESFSKALIR